MKTEVLKTVLLLALPASGKSEVRHLLANIDPERLKRDFHIGENFQLDDFPYVHFMRRIDEELVKLGEPRIFYPSNEQPFVDDRDWGTLIHLLNADYHDLMNRVHVEARSMARWLFDRIDRASLANGMEPRIALLTSELRGELARALDDEAAEVRALLESQYSDSYHGKTLVVECARGGADGAEMPLTGGHGYLYSLSRLTPDLLEDAVILYIWVTPEESRRKNEARANPDDPGSNLFHGVPLPVMLGDYGVCDMPYLIEQSDQENTIRVEAHGRVYHLPIGVFDNREDKTSFLRDDPEAWDPALLDEVSEAIRQATESMWELYSA